MSFMNIVSIVTGVLLVTIAAGSNIMSLHYLRRIDCYYFFMLIIASICGVAAILAGIYLK